MLWHPDASAETEALSTLVAEFESLQPEVRVSRYAVDEEELLARFQESARQGLGPDLLVAPGAWVPELVEAGLVQDLEGEDVNRSAYLSLALAPLYVDGKLYGLPLSLHPQALYYNRSLVREPARDLDALLADADRDRLVALPSTFDDSFWGNQAFGGRLQDEEGRIALDEGGYAGWLGWLEAAQDTPGVVLERDRATLRELFTEGRAAYYVAGPEERPALREALGEQLGVATLPSGPYGRAGPFVPVSGMLVGRASTPDQVAAALDLAEYLSGEHGGRVILRGSDLIPANANVRVSADADPEAFAFSSQARFGVPLSTLPQVAAARRIGDDVIQRVLTDKIEPAQAARQISVEANEAAGVPPREQTWERCGPAGTLRVRHAFEGRAELAIAAEAERYRQRCPEVFVELVRGEEEEIVAALRAGATDSDLVLLSSWRLHRLHQDGLIGDMPFAENQRFWQRYAPSTTQTVERNEQLYGAPIALHLHALATDVDALPDAPATLAELQASADRERPVALARDFHGAYWGIGAQGGLRLDGDGRVSVPQDGLEAWLAWLVDAEEDEGLLLSETPIEEADAIAEVIRESDLERMRGAATLERMRVVGLPGGAGGPAAPLLLSSALALTAAAEDDEGARLERSLSWIEHLSATDAQRRLAEDGDLLPATADVHMDGLPALRGFVEQARSAVAIPPRLDDETFLAEGERLFASVLDEGAEIASAVCRFRVAVNQASGFEDEGPCDDA